jgi:hypothetical protein
MPTRHVASAMVCRSFVAATACLAAAFAAAAARPSSAQPAVAEQSGAFTIADGALSLEAPSGWQRVQPKSGIVETEFSIPSEGASADGTPLPAGRMTVMGAGGTVDANIERWYGQFSQPDGGSTKDKAAVKKLKVAGRDVTLVDVSGTYKDSPGGPFAGGKTIERPGYRMLAAILESPEGNYFLKFYGPAATVEKHAAGFRTMVEGIVPASK